MQLLYNMRAAREARGRSIDREGARRGGGGRGGACASPRDICIELDASRGQATTAVATSKLATGSRSTIRIDLLCSTAVKDPTSSYSTCTS